MFDRRKALVLTTAALLAGCKVIPTAPPPAPKPPPGPSEVLPEDQKRHRVALLVPLTGANSQVGQSVANATTMALLDTNAQTVRITSYDTAAGPAVAIAQAMKDGNRLVLGPLGAGEVEPVAAAARADRKSVV